MKPSKWQYLIADDVWVWRLTISWLVVVPLLTATLAGIECEPNLEALHQWRYSLLFAGVVLLALLTGFVLGSFPGIPILASILITQGEINGAPYRKGDNVRILSGEYRDRVGTVVSYSLLRRHEDTVELKCDEAITFLAPWQVCRESQ